MPPKKPGLASVSESFAAVSDWLTNEAPRHGLDVARMSHSIDTSAIRHILKKHGDAAFERARGQIAITDDDIKAIPEILAAPDKIAFGTKSKMGRNQVASVKRLALHL